MKVVQEANWYKPEPGEPYRPLIAIPSKVLELDSGFESCTAKFFTAYDPPTALRPATALAPLVSTKDSHGPPAVPMPSPTHDSGARKTVTASNEAPIPAQGQNLPLPEKTTDPKPGLGGSGNGPSNQAGTNEQSGQGADPSQPSDPKQPNNAVQNGGDPGPGTDLGLPNDPKQPSNVLGDIGDGGDVHPPSSPGDPIPDPPETTISIGGHTVVAGTSGIQVDGVKVKAGGPPATVSGIVAINRDNSIVIAHQIVPLSVPTAPGTTIAGHAITPVSDGVSIDGTVVTPGAPPVTISGTPVSVDSSSHIYLRGALYELPTANPAPPTVLPNGAVAVPLADGVSIYGTTLTAGAPAVSISGTAVSLDPAHNLIWGGTAEALPSPAPLPLAGGQVTTIDGQVVRPLSDGVSIAGVRLTPDAPPIMVSGTRVSLGASALVIGTSTIPIALNPLALIPGQVTTVAGNSVQRLSNGISVAGTTLTPDAQPVTVSGTRISLGASALVIGSSTILLPAEAPTPFVTTIAGEAITAAPNGVEIAGSTLSPGALGVTIGGTLVSLDSAGELVVGSKTISLEGSSGGGLGGLIMEGFGSGDPFPSPASPLAPGDDPTSGSGNGTAFGVQAFQGHAHVLKSYRPAKLSTAVTLAIAVLLNAGR